MGSIELIIGKNIRKYRYIKQIKQEVLAKEIGISRVMLSRYENGRSSIPLKQLTIISTKLEVSIEALLL